MRNLNMEQRLDRVESRAQIEELIARYGIACDDRDVENLAACFTPDIRIGTPNGSMKAQGLDSVMSMYNDLFKVRGPGFHWSHDRIIKFDDADPDVATGLVLSHAETYPAGNVSIAGMRYFDKYRRTDCEWRFSERVLNFVYYMPIVDYLDRFKQAERVKTPEGWAKADFPEGSPSWDRWHREHLED